ncbi:hypothetical protein [Streptacidiphilus jiangxiensis]|uniref:DUF2029 domain-containing protein n=1 Tax=Streptacidiphilus jiangxiensis TaxID=235985 RepID=A0A1H7P149_STRJI|nr:hypothetical protein [Streptacidiphilus jiangxiensis]SEL29028.1 hypothetical protein SAMN05414137_107151 [Streptacidiphilus jiangxiensis]
MSLRASWHRWALTLWALVWMVAEMPGGAYSWHYFSHGSALLFDGAGANPPGGLHLYANYPSLQIGPFAFVCAQVLRSVGPDNGVVAGQLVMTAAGLLVLHTLERCVATTRPDLEQRPAALRRTLVLGGGVFLVVWESLAVHYGHLDDALALLCAVLAVRALLADAPAVAGLCLGLAVDAKPWALAFLPLVLAAPRIRRRHVAVYAAATVVLAWLPFVLADPGTLTATQYAIVNEPSSALRALGVGSAGTPSWDRLAQLVTGCGLGLWAVLRGRWQAVLLLGVGARIALDPGVYAYYTAGLLVGTLCWELLGLRRPVPLWSLTAFAGLHLAPGVVGDPSLLGDLRLWTVLLLAAGAMLVPRDRCAGRSLPGATPAAITDPALVVGDLHRLPERLEMTSR